MSVSSTIQYAKKPLPPNSKRGIRLLTIHRGESQHFPFDINCSLTACDLDSKPQYEALSFTWGPENHVAAIKVDGEVLEVRHNLLFALRRLRYPNCPRVMWIDAVCIDQSNLDERSSTVSYMSDIYSCATGGVIAWLGQESLDTYIVNTFIEQFINGFE